MSETASVHNDVIEAQMDRSCLRDLQLSGVKTRATKLGQKVVRRISDGGKPRRSVLELEGFWVNIRKHVLMMLEIFGRGQRRRNRTFVFGDSLYFSLGAGDAKR